MFSLKEFHRMKRIAGLICIVFLALTAVAQTNVSGGIYSNTTWTLAGSPYVVTGSVVVFPGKTLTIEPGCVVNFIADTTFNISNFKYLEIRGNLYAVGTAENRIVFTSTDTTDSSYNWMGIRIKGSQGGTVQLNNFELHNSWYGLHNDVAEPGVSYAFTNCNFKNNNYAIQLNADMSYTSCIFEKNGVGQAAQIQYGSLTANNCSFIQNLCSFTWSNSIFINECVFDGNQNNIIGSPGTIQNCSFYNNLFALIESANMQISNCIFEGNETAIDENGNSTISGCQFSNNTVAVKLGGNSVLTNNTISNNQTGVQVRAYEPTTTLINNNQLCNNLLYNLENLTDKNFEVNTNCFCSTDSATIENSIYDGYDDITRGLVNYTIYDEACDSVIRAIAKVILEEPAAISNTGFNKPTWKAVLFQNILEINAEIPSRFRIHNLAGQVILEGNLTAGVSVIQLNLGSGIYILSNDKGDWIKVFKD